MVSGKIRHMLNESDNESEGLLEDETNVLPTNTSQNEFGKIILGAPQKKVAIQDLIPTSDKHTDCYKSFLSKLRKFLLLNKLEDNIQNHDIQLHTEVRNIFPYYNLILMYFLDY